MDLSRSCRGVWGAQVRCWVSYAHRPSPMEDVQYVCSCELTVWQHFAMSNWDESHPLLIDFTICSNSVCLLAIESKSLLKEPTSVCRAFNSLSTSVKFAVKIVNIYHCENSCSWKTLGKPCMPSLSENLFHVSYLKCFFRYNLIIVHIN
jgi:hypothetical protein